MALSSGTAWLAVQTAGSAAASRFEGVEASIASALILTFAVSLAAIYLWRSSPRRHTGKLVADQFVDCAAFILEVESRKLNVPSPRLLVTSSESIRDARVYFIGLRAVVILPETICWLAINRPDELKAVLSHELSHIANGDAWRGAAARVATVAVTTIVIVSGIVITAAHAYGIAQVAASFTFLEAVRPRNLLRYLQSVVTPAVCLAVTLAAFATFLRLREYVADVTAATAGHQRALRLVLSRAAATARSHQNFVSFHPSARARLSRLKPLNFNRGPGAGALFAATVALLAFDSLCNRLQPSDHDVLSILLTGAQVVLYLLLFASLGLYLGRSSSFRGRRHRYWLILRQSTLAAGAVLLGALAVQMSIELPMLVRVGAPLEVDLLWAVRAALLASLIPITTLLCSLIVGAFSHRGGPPKQSPEAALIVLAVAVSYVASGVTTTAFGWLTRSLLDLSPADAIFAFDDLVGVGSMASVVVAAGAVVVLLGVACSGAAFQYFRVHSIGRRRQTAVLLGIALAVVGCNILLALSWVVPAAHISERETLWVQCVGLPGAGGSDTIAIQRLTEALATTLDDTLTGVTTQRGNARAKLLLPSECSARQRDLVDSYGATRMVLARMRWIQDSSLTLSLLDAQNVLVRYEGASGRTWEQLRPLQTISIERIAAELLAVHDPHRWAIRLMVMDSRNAGAAETILLGLREKGSDFERPWANLQLANLAIGRGSYETAETYIRQAHSLAPESEVVRRRLALVLLRQSKCGEAADFLPALLGSRHLTVAHVTHWSWCEAMRGTPRDRLAILWRFRFRFSDDAHFVANIGLSAYEVRSLDLAIEYLRAAQKLDPANQEWCVPLYLACLTTTPCPTPAPHEPPIRLTSASQNACWGRILKGHVPPKSAAFYLRRALELQPDLGRAGLERELKMLLGE